MIHNNNEHTKQADSFDEVYGIDIGGIKEFNTAYEKWAKAKGAKVISLGVSTGITAERTGKFYERMGFNDVGKFYRRRS